MFRGAGDFGVIISQLLLLQLYLSLLTSISLDRIKEKYRYVVKAKSSKRLS